MKGAHKSSAGQRNKNRKGLQAQFKKKKLGHWKIVFDGKENALGKTIRIFKFVINQRFF